MKHTGARSWSWSIAAGVPARAGGVAVPLRTMIRSCSNTEAVVQQTILTEITVGMRDLRTLCTIRLFTIALTIVYVVWLLWNDVAEQPLVKSIQKKVISISDS